MTDYKAGTCLSVEEYLEAFENAHSLELKELTTSNRGSTEFLRISPHQIGLIKWGDDRIPDLFTGGFVAYECIDYTYDPNLKSLPELEEVYNARAQFHREGYPGINDILGVGDGHWQLIGMLNGQEMPVTRNRVTMDEKIAWESKATEKQHLKRDAFVDKLIATSTEATVAEPTIQFPIMVRVVTTSSLYYAITVSNKKTAEGVILHLCENPTVKSSAFEDFIPILK